jgi:hypothetical protein
MTVRVFLFLSRPFPGIAIRAVSASLPIQPALAVQSSITEATRPRCTILMLAPSSDTPPVSGTVV